MNDLVSGTAFGCAHINFGLDFIADRFLRSTAVTWSDNVLEVMRHLGKAALFGRVTAFKHHRPVEDLVSTGLRYQWRADGDVKEICESEDHLFEMTGKILSHWGDLLSRNEVVIVNEDDDRSGLDGLLDLSLSSAMLVPVFVDEHWWGFFGFEDERVRKWTMDEVETLKAVATIYGSAIWRKRLEEELEEQKESVEHQVKERTQQLESARLELELAARRAQEQKARLLASIQSLSVGFLMTDIKGDVMLSNDAVKRILQQEELSIGHVKDLDNAFGGDSQITRRLHTCVDQVKAIRLDDMRYEDRYVDMWLTPITTVDRVRRVIGVVLLIDDVTEAKMLQQSRDEFFAVASHELRTPLTAIRGNASMMLDYFPKEMKDEQLREIVEDIYSSSKRLIDIVNEYLDVSKMEMDHVELELVPVDLVRICEGVMETIAITAKDKGLEFELQTNGLLELVVLGDVRRLQQILFNLIGNAIKYTDSGGIYVKLEDMGTTGRVIVFDTGPGIIQEKHNLLFQKFSQLGDRAYQRHVKNSTGMGLYIAKLLAEAMDAKVYLEKSEPGVGSGFAVELRKAM